MYDTQHILHNIESTSHFLSVTIRSFLWLFGWSVCLVRLVSYLSLYQSEFLSLFLSHHIKFRLTVGTGDPFITG